MLPGREEDPSLRRNIKCRSMYRADGLVDRQHDDQPLDLTPVTEMQMIADIATVIGPGGGFEAGIVPEARDQFGSVVVALAIGEERQLHIG